MDVIAKEVKVSDLKGLNDGFLLNEGRNAGILLLIWGEA